MLIPTIVSVTVVLAPVGGAALPALVASIGVDLVVLGAIWVALRPGRPDVRSSAELEALARGGKPVLVELYSNFCIICMANRQTMRSVTATVGATCRVARVELPSKGGRDIADAYRILYTPSFLLFDEHGDHIRTIVPDTVTPLANGYRILDATGALVGREPRVTAELLVGLVRRAA